MLIIFFFILGTVWGSFLNCLVYRLKNKKSMWGRSFCPHCKHTLGFWDLFPLFSYLFLKGRCRYCRRKIDIQYFLVELFTGFVFALGYWFYFVYQAGFLNNILFLTFYLVISLFLIVIFIYDLKYYLVLDVVVWPAIIISFLFNFLTGHISLFNLLLAGGGGVLFFGLQFIVSKGKWVGGGDILIGLLAGFIVGWPNIIIAIFTAYILGSVIGIFLLSTRKKQWSSPIPFGPFLVFGIFLSMLFGNIIQNWYLGQVLGF